MKFSQGQLRDTVGISIETFRHWKRVLPPFALRRRYTPDFSLGDVLAAAVLHRLTDDCGIRVGSLPKVSKAVVEICNAHPWTVLDGRTLVVDLHAGDCRLVRSARELSGDEIVVVCPLTPIISALRTSLIRVQPTAAQHPLLFPPTALESPNRRRRA